MVDVKFLFDILEWLGKGIRQFLEELPDLIFSKKTLGSFLDEQIEPIDPSIADSRLTMLSEMEVYFSQLPPRVHNLFIT